MTRKLGLINIAEYIENEATLEKVKELGIQYGQGYFFSEALDGEELLARYGKA